MLGLPKDERLGEAARHLRKTVRLLGPDLHRVLHALNDLGLNVLPVLLCCRHCNEALLSHSRVKVPQMFCLSFLNHEYGLGAALNVPFS